MILTCPNCGTQYAVKDGAIPEGGRQVRCAACKHSWHQNPDAISPSPEPAAPEIEQVQTEAVAEEAEPETLAEATLIEPRSGPEAEERAYEEAMAETDGQSEPFATPTANADWHSPPAAEAQDDIFSPFADREDEEAPRRRSPLLVIVILIVLIAALAAAFWFLAPPEWKSSVGLAGAGSSPLALVTTHMDRQRLQSGNELLTITGRVINPTSKDQDVPPLQAQLRSRGGKLVYSWTIAPPARTLAPGASARFNSTEVDVPPGGDELTITVGAG